MPGGRSRRGSRSNPGVEFGVESCDEHPTASVLERDALDAALERERVDRPRGPRREGEIAKLLAVHSDTSRAEGKTSVERACDPTGRCAHQFDGPAGSVTTPTTVASITSFGIRYSLPNDRDETIDMWHLLSNRPIFNYKCRNVKCFSAGSLTVVRVFPMEYRPEPLPVVPAGGRLPARGSGSSIPDASSGRPISPGRGSSRGSPDVEVRGGHCDGRNRPRTGGDRGRRTRDSLLGDRVRDRWRNRRCDDRPGLPALQRGTAKGVTLAVTTSGVIVLHCCFRSPRCTGTVPERLIALVGNDPRRSPTVRTTSGSSRSGFRSRG